MNHEAKEATGTARKRHNQKGRKETIIVSFALDLDTLATIDKICAESVTKLDAPLTRSAWIKRAISRDLAHKERGRRCNRKPKTVGERDDEGEKDQNPTLPPLLPFSSIHENKDLTILMG